MKHKRLRFTLHLLGREIFSLSIEWIKGNPGEGYEQATLPITWGNSVFIANSVQSIFYTSCSKGLRLENRINEEMKAVVEESKIYLISFA